MEISAADLATGAFGVIGFFASGFILLSMGGTVYIVDQHAAHERVRLEMLQCVEAGHELPAQSAGGDALRMLEMSALDCTLFDRSPQGSRPTLERLKSRACRGAITISQQISALEARRLLVALGSCALPFICAHGRPTIVAL